MYRAPLQDIEFALNHVVGADALAGCPDYSEYTPELAASVLQEAARIAENVLDPLYKTADREGARWSESGVTTRLGGNVASMEGSSAFTLEIMSRVEDFPIF